MGTGLRPRLGVEKPLGGAALTAALGQVESGCGPGALQAAVSYLKIRAWVERSRVGVTSWGSQPILGLLSSPSSLPGSETPSVGSSKDGLWHRPRSQDTWILCLGRHPFPCLAL